MRGDGNDDELYGQLGDDELSGGDGFDLLDGGPGDDSCDGGELHDQRQRLRAPAPRSRGARSLPLALTRPPQTADSGLNPARWPVAPAAGERARSGDRELLRRRLGRDRSGGRPSGAS